LPSVADQICHGPVEQTRLAPGDVKVALGGRHAGSIDSARVNAATASSSIPLLK
jgi:hypothetical protein